MSGEKSFKVGCANEVIKVNLFTELSGYGGFRGRRNRGVHDDLHCKAASFNIHGKRFILITNDLIFMDRKASGEIRKRLSKLHALPPASVMICGSHTHSAPLIAPCPGLGELDGDFRASWIETVVEAAGRAIKDETPVSMAGGRVPITRQFGINRTDKNGPVDQEIRWSTFTRHDGTTKLLIYNHGMHAVVFGADMFFVSADWPGAVSSLILGKKLADNVMFLQGACGDINPVECCKGLKEGEAILENLFRSYANDIENGLKHPEFQDQIPALNFSMEEVKLPCREYSKDDLRRIAATMKKQDSHSFTRDRIEEMIIMMEREISVDIITDLQVVGLGNLYFYAVPAELFFLLGKELMNQSPGKLAFVSEVTNDNCSYIPIFESEDDSALFCNKPIDYGAYETLFVNFQFLKLPYKKTVGEYLVGKMIAMAKTLKKEITKNDK